MAIFLSRNEEGVRLFYFIHTLTLYGFPYFATIKQESENYIPPNEGALRRNKYEPLGACFSPRQPAVRNPLLERNKT